MNPLENRQNGTNNNKKHIKIITYFFPVDSIIYNLNRKLFTQVKNRVSRRIIISYIISALSETGGVAPLLAIG